MTIPDDWTVSTAEQLCHFENNRRVPVSESERAKRPGEIPYYGANGLQGYIDRAIFNEDLILLAEDGGHYDDFTNRPIAYRITGPAWVNNHAHVIRSRDPNFQNFLFFSLEHKDIRADIVGGTRGKLNLGQLKNLQIAHPVNVSESIAIAEIIQSADDVLRSQRTLISKLEMIRGGLLNDLLTYGMDEDGALRSPGTHDFVDSRIGPTPSSWSVANLGDFLSRPPKNGYSPVEGDGSSGIGMLGLGCLTDSGFQPSQIKKAPEWDNKFESALLSDGDLLMSRSNTRALVGLAGIYRDIGTACIYPDTMMKLQANDRTSNQFLEYLLRCEQVRRRIQNLSRGTSGSMKKINGNIVQNFLVAIPPLPEQNRIADLIQAIDCRINSEAILLEKYRKIKLGLMNDLLTGRVRVPTPAPDGVEVAA